MSEQERAGQENHEKEDPFYAGQGRIFEMIATSAPLEDILTRIVLLMEAQADGLRCSILLLSNDGKHVRHGAAPNLPKICGLQACWSTPIISSDGDVLGSFAMYCQEPRGPNSQETRLIEAATQVA